MDTITPKEPLELLLKEDGNINFTDTFKFWFAKNAKEDDVEIEKLIPLVTTAAKLAGKAGALGTKGAVGGAKALGGSAKGLAQGASSLASKPFGKKSVDSDSALDLLNAFLSKTHHDYYEASEKATKAFGATNENEGTSDQTEENSADAFTLQDKETDVVFQKNTDGENLEAQQEKVFNQVTRDYNKDEDIEKQDNDLVTEYSTQQIERDAGMVSADSNVPSTPSMGWFDMLKEEIKADVLTDIEMTKSYPDWQQDKESYAEHREIIKNKITEGYK